VCFLHKEVAFCPAVPSQMTDKDGLVYNGGLEETNIGELDTSDEVEVLVSLPVVLPLPCMVHTLHQLVDETKSAHKSLASKHMLYDCDSIPAVLCSFEIQDVHLGLPEKSCSATEEVPSKEATEEVSSSQTLAPPPLHMQLYVRYYVCDCLMMPCIMMSWQRQILITLSIIYAAMLSTVCLQLPLSCVHAETQTATR
jgi:hypothetical protein